jgi:PadR family transcriptional regulator PadR
LSIIEASLSIVEVSLSSLVRDAPTKNAETIRSSPGHGRSADPQDTRARAASWLAHLEAHPALHRLEHQGWIEAEWKETELGRSGKFYSLTRDGRQQLEREMENWKRLSSAVGLLLKRA